MLKIKVRKSIKKITIFLNTVQKKLVKNIILQSIFTKDFETKIYIELILIITIIISQFFLLTYRCSGQLVCTSTNLMGREVNDHVSYQWPWEDSNSWLLGGKFKTWLVELPLKVHNNFSKLIFRVDVESFLLTWIIINIY
jgi:hypothetical protein